MHTTPYKPSTSRTRLLIEMELQHVTSIIPLSFLQVSPHHAVIDKADGRQPQSRPPPHHQRMPQTKKRQKHLLESRAKRQQRLSGGRYETCFFEAMHGEWLWSRPCSRPRGWTGQTGLFRSLFSLRWQEFRVNESFSPYERVCVL